MKSRKIIIVAPYQLDKVGGVERFILSFTQAAQNISKACVIYNPFKFHSDSLNVIHELDNTEYDLCISHAIYGLGAMPRARRRIHTFHGTILGNLFQRPWLWIHPKFLQWLAMESASRREKEGIIGVSDWAVREIHRMGYRGPIDQIPSGGGFESQRLSQPRKSSKAHELLCLFCGRSSDKVKRFALIREGIRLVRQKNENIRLLVVGGTSAKSEPGIEYLGDKPYYEVLELMKKVQIQINASYYEGYSLSLSEGIFQAGLITLATPVGGNLNTLVHGKTGFFFQSPRELATYLLSLSRNSELKDALFTNIFKEMPILSWEQVAKRTLDFAFSLPKNNETWAD